MGVDVADDDAAVSLCCSVARHTSAGPEPSNPSRGTEQEHSACHCSCAPLGHLTRSVVSIVEPGGRLMSDLRSSAACSSRRSRSCQYELRLQGT